MILKVLDPRTILLRSFTGRYETRTFYNFTGNFFSVSQIRYLKGHGCRSIVRIGWRPTPSRSAKLPAVSTRELGLHRMELGYGVTGTLTCGGNYRRISNGARFGEPDEVSTQFGNAAIPQSSGRQPPKVTFMKNGRTVIHCVLPRSSRPRDRSSAQSYCAAVCLRDAECVVTI
eukprot:RCo000735